MEFLSNYGLFFLETFTVVIAIIAVIITIAGVSSKNKSNGALTINKINDYFDEMRDKLQETVLNKKEQKQIKKLRKQEEKKLKAKEKTGEAISRKKIYVVDFHGDIKASDVKNLREEITAILTLANKDDEVVVKIESGGGVVHGYGLAASQLQRLRTRKIPLTICIDKVAASGGYMMACVGTKILAAPFAIVGSIGVLAQIPNLHRWLEKNKIDFEQLTAGEYKRTLTLFGKNDDKAREKMQEELEDTHILFKDFINQNRPQVDLDKAATGEHWFGARAIDLKLVDQLITSDDYLQNAAESSDLYQIKYSEKKSFSNKLGCSAQALIEKSFLALQNSNNDSKYLN